MNLSRHDEARVDTLVELKDVLYKIECLINFHQEKKFQEDFPHLRRALAVARLSAQALRDPVILNENPKAEVTETLVIRIQSYTGERSVTTVPAEQSSILHAPNPVGSTSSDRLHESD